MSIQDHRIFFLFFGTILLGVPHLALEISKPSDGNEWNETLQPHGLKSNSIKIEQNEPFTNEHNQRRSSDNDLFKGHEDTSSVLQTRVPNPFNFFNSHSISYNGNYLNIDQNGVHAEVISPRNSQLITIRGRKVFLNYRVICKNTRRLRDEPTYQKKNDGSMWYTNLRVGTKMTPEEAMEFKKQLEEKRAQAEEMKNRVLAAAQQAVKQGEAAAKMGQEIGQNAMAAAQKQGEAAAKMGQDIGQNAMAAAQKQGEAAAKMGQEIGQKATAAAQEAVKQGEAAAKVGQDIGQNAMDMGRKLTEDALEMTRNVGKSFSWWSW